MTNIDINFNNGVEIPKVKKAYNKKKKQTFKKKLKTLDLIKKDIAATLKYAGGKYVTFDDTNHTEGLLIGGAIIKYPKSKDAKFIVVDKNKNIVFIDSFEHFSYIKDIPSSLYILNYVYTRDTTYFYNLIMGELEDNENIEVFTNIYMNKGRNK